MKHFGKMILEDKLCHYIATSGSFQPVKPFRAHGHVCEYCGGTSHFTYSVDLDENGECKRAWLCTNIDCVTYNERSWMNTCPSTQKPKRALEWAKFCEMNGIGDLHHDVTFDQVIQSDGKIDYMTRFVEEPIGFIIMQGDKGTGKTYCAMAMCELFTRTNPHCIFTTQKRMHQDWLNSFACGLAFPYVPSLKSCNLLIIDDFGTAEMSKDFLAFFMELIDYRMQWKKRGTVITTNLNDDKLIEFCGEPMCDRFNTGQTFIFEGKTRRKSKPI